MIDVVSEAKTEILEIPGGISGPRWLYYTLGVFFICCGAARIVSTYHVFNQIADEPMHIACGLEWWDRGTYTIETQHPPLSRIAVALGPYLVGARIGPNAREEKVKAGVGWFVIGNRLLATGGAYWRNLALARLGILPFFVLSCVVVWLWSERAFGARTALLATLFYTCLPVVLAHSALATTDMPVTATLCASLFCLVLWVENPDRLNTGLLGITLGLALLSKFSVLLFFPVCVLVLLVVCAFGDRGGQSVVRRFRKHSLSTLAVLIIAALVVWAGYRFALTPFVEAGSLDAAQDQKQVVHLLGRHPALLKTAETLLHVPLPAMQAVRGVASVWGHNRTGHDAYLLGEWSNAGWWYFFPVLLAVKTPLAFLVLTLAGLVLLSRMLRVKTALLKVAPALFALAILAASLSARINIGLRHVLVIFPLLAIVAGYVAETILAQRKSVALRVAGGGLIAWLLVSSALAHPDYLAYFNALAGGRPERITVDSDLDWGQDLQRLSDRLRQRGVGEVASSYFGTADVRKFGLPPFRDLTPYEKVSGWVAISARNLEMPAEAIPYRPAPGLQAVYLLNSGFTGFAGTEGGPFAWLKAYAPAERVGKSIFLYYIPPEK